MRIFSVLDLWIEMWTCAMFYIWVLPKCFHWICWIQWLKIFVITVKWFELATSCVRDWNATITPERYMWETGSLSWPQSMLQRFIRLLEFAEFTEFPFHLGKTLLFVSIILIMEGLRFMKLPTFWPLCSQTFRVWHLGMTDWTMLWGQSGAKRYKSCQGKVFVGQWFMKPVIP